MTAALTAPLADPMVPVPFRVQRTWRETHDTFTFTLRPEDELRALAFAPGQFNMLYTFGVGEVPISISGDPGRKEDLVHTIRAVGLVTEALRRLKHGATVGVRGPFGSGWPVATAEGQDVVLVAGGLGLAPLRPALYHMLAHRERYGRVVLLYGTRSPSDLLYAKELKTWAARRDVDVEVIVTTATPAWRGHVGVVTTLLPRMKLDPTRAVAMMCGPEIMMRYAAEALMQADVPAARQYVSLERNMKCAVGFCGHCMFGPTFVCKDGPVFRYDRVQSLLALREV